MKSIYIVASARDYHAMDWYHLVKDLCPRRKVCMLTDLIKGEGFDDIRREGDQILVMFPTDKFLFSTQSKFGNVWRNLVKLILAPVIAIRIHMIGKSEPQSFFHAHSMYYIFLCWLARVRFIGTPQGSDVLVRPNKSRIYRLFTKLSLRAATGITVDSLSLQESVRKLCGAESKLIQNGIDSVGTKRSRSSTGPRTHVVSIRAVDPNYRVLEILNARNRAASKVKIDFIYPFYEETYRDRVRSLLSEEDAEHGRVSKASMYSIFEETRLAISIPISDSSPRTVYEAIFCGCVVVVSYGAWIHQLPDSMRARIIVADLSSDHWFDDALIEADRICVTQFIPCNDAIRNFDEIEAMKMMCKTFYEENFDA